MTNYYTKKDKRLFHQRLPIDIKQINNNIDKFIINMLLS